MISLRCPQLTRHSLVRFLEPRRNLGNSSRLLTLQRSDTTHGEPINLMRHQ